MFVHFNRSTLNNNNRPNNGNCGFIDEYYITLQWFPIFLNCELSFFKFIYRFQFDRNFYDYR